MNDNKYFWDDEEPQPFPSDLINLIQQEEQRERSKQRPPKCDCSEPPSGGCVC